MGYVGKAVLAAAVLLAAAGALAVIYEWPLDQGPAAPVQPVAFSHAVHAGAYRIPCLHCHAYARTADAAGVPDMALCRECHPPIGRDRPEVKKLLGYLKEGRPVPWVKVHDLPDHVTFPHKMHLAAGLECAACHGDVASMDRVRRVASLKMGWCLGCHKERGAEIDCVACHK